VLKAIVCVDNKWAIGKDNDLLFNLKEDMRFFRLKTSEQIVFCGRKTLQSFPGSKPLANRSTICLCSEGYERNDCYCIHDFNQAVKLVTELAKTKDVYVIGGAMLYEAMMPYYDQIYVTRVDADGNGTVFFPSLDDQTEFILTDESFEVEENGYKYKFCTYERRFKNER
jgi:dihydrofolate reductase